MATVIGNPAALPGQTRAGARAAAGRDALLVWLFGLAVAGALLQITLGGVVRVTGSGLGCPDWPLCHGSIVPVFRDYHTALEWSHRLTGTVLGLTIIAATARAWFERQPGRGILGFALRSRRDGLLAGVSLGLLALVAVVGGIGGSVVLTELDPALRTLHLALAEGVIFLAALGWVASAYGPAESRAADRDAARAKALRLTALAGAAVLIALLSGSYAVWRGAGAVCPSWPLCGGPVVPENTLTWLHMAHRLLAGLGVIVAVWAAHRAYRLADMPARLKQASLAVLTLAAVQVLIGAANPWTDFGQWARALHLSLATLLWLTLTLAALLILRPQTRVALAREPHRSSAS